jgi:hypothetical protein
MLMRENFDSIRHEMVSPYISLRPACRAFRVSLARHPVFIFTRWQR